jgi:hypothetical protein
VESKYTVANGYTADAKVGGEEGSLTMLSLWWFKITQNSTWSIWGMSVFSLADFMTALINVKIQT